LLGYKTQEALKRAEAEGIMAVSSKKKRSSREQKREDASETPLKKEKQFAGKQLRILSTGLFLISFSLLSDEIVLTRVLSAYVKI